MDDEDILAVTNRNQFKRNQRNGDYNQNLNNTLQNQPISNLSKTFGC